MSISIEILTRELSEYEKATIKAYQNTKRNDAWSYSIDEYAQIKARNDAIIKELQTDIQILNESYNNKHTSA
jgi:hypothetical protein